MNRFGAFAVHLGISALIFVILGYIILFHWYPEFFFTSDGGWQGIRIVTFVDLVLGPLLTLVVYKKGKPSLRFDLTCIGVLQAVCLTAGMWVVYSERPIAMVFTDGWFHSMSSGDYAQVGQSVPDLSSFEGSSPKWVTVRLPEDPVLQSEVRKDAFQASIPTRNLSEYYTPFELAHIDVEQHGLSDEELLSRDAKTPFLTKFFEANGGQIAEYRFLPFGTRYSLALMAYHITSGELTFVEIPGGMLGTDAEATEEQ